MNQKKELEQHLKLKVDAVISYAVVRSDNTFVIGVGKGRSINVFNL